VVFDDEYPGFGGVVHLAGMKRETSVPKPGVDLMLAVPPASSTRETIE
jgi:hypothetical protein